MSVPAQNLDQNKLNQVFANVDQMLQAAGYQQPQQQETHPILGTLASAALGGAGGYLMGQNDRYGNDTNNVLAGMAYGMTNGFNKRTQAKKKRQDASSKLALEKVKLIPKVIEYQESMGEDQVQRNAAQMAGYEKLIDGVNQLSGKAGKAFKEYGGNMAAQPFMRDMAEEKIQRGSDTHKQNYSEFFDKLENDTNKQKGGFEPVNAIHGGVSQQQGGYNPLLPHSVTQSAYNSMGNQVLESAEKGFALGQKSHNDSLKLQETRRKNNKTESGSKEKDLIKIRKEIGDVQATLMQSDAKFAEKPDLAFVISKYIATKPNRNTKDNQKYRAAIKRKTGIDPEMMYIHLKSSSTKTGKDNKSTEISPKAQKMMQDLNKPWWKK